MKALYNTDEALRKIRTAFKVLRQEGVQAQTRYVCCEQCGRPVASYFIPHVYILREDEMEFRVTGVLPVHYRSPDPDPASQRALGDQVHILLKLNGLEVEWNGDPNHVVMVMA